MASPRAIALIPARGGSQGIPGKNIRMLAGKPLIHWTLRAALGCKGIDAVYVSTDDDAIAEIARQLPGVVVIPRAAQTATHDASTESVIMDAMGRIGSFDDLVLIQATSPLLTSRDLEQGFAVRARNGAQSCLSVVRQKRFLWRDRGDGRGEAANYDPVKRPRRQEFAGHLVENGAFYMSSRAAIAASGCRLNGDIALCEMDPSSYHELDEMDDWLSVEALMLARRPLRAAAVKLLVTDVDGTLTDGGMYYGTDGEALKRFDTRDAAGMDRLRVDFGVRLAVITKEDSPSVRARCRKLRIDLEAHGCLDKVAMLKEWCRTSGLSLDEIAYIGDDLNDLPALRLAGYAAAPADGAAPCREAADFVCSRPGGCGAVREFADHILAAKKGVSARSG